MSLGGGEGYLKSMKNAFVQFLKKTERKTELVDICVKSQLFESALFYLTRHKVLQDHTLRTHTHTHKTNTNHTIKKSGVQSKFLPWVYCCFHLFKHYLWIATSSFKI